LREILSSSQAIRGTSEEWLVEVGLSPAPREMVNLKSLKGMLRSSVMMQPSREGNKRDSEVPVRKSTSAHQTGSLKEARWVGQRKNPRSGPEKSPKAVTRETTAHGMFELGGPSQGEGSTSTRGKGHVVSSGDDPSSRKTARPRSFQALSMADLPEGEPRA
ncbi:unnamed protein product, partial [Musa hybrid cultivar]